MARLLLAARLTDLSDACPVTAMETLGPFWPGGWTGRKRAVLETIKYLGKLQRAHYDLTGIMVRKGNYPLMALFQVSEIL